MQKPLTYDQRLETRIKDSKNTLQHILDDLLEFSEPKQMKINTVKSSVMKICKSRTKVYPTEIQIGENFLNVKEEMKIVGVILTPNLKWSSNTAYICKKAYSSLWTIRRMKILGLDVSTILDFYVKEVRVHLELAVPVWHSGLTKKLCADIERVQRVAVRIMVDDVDYRDACLD